LLHVCIGIQVAARQEAELVHIGRRALFGGGGGVARIRRVQLHHMLAAGGEEQRGKDAALWDGEFGYVSIGLV
jgi:hypothetical protein